MTSSSSSFILPFEEPIVPKIGPTYCINCAIDLENNYYGSPIRTLCREETDTSLHSVVTEHEATKYGIPEGKPGSFVTTIHEALAYLFKFDPTSTSSTPLSSVLKINIKNLVLCGECAGVLTKLYLFRKAFAKLTSEISYLGLHLKALSEGDDYGDLAEKLMPMMEATAGAAAAADGELVMMSDADAEMEAAAAAAAEAQAQEEQEHHHQQLHELEQQQQLQAMVEHHYQQQQQQQGKQEGGTSLLHPDGETTTVEVISPDDLQMVDEEQLSFYITSGSEIIITKPDGNVQVVVAREAGGPGGSGLSGLTTLTRTGQQQHMEFEVSTAYVANELIEQQHEQHHFQLHQHHHQAHHDDDGSGTTMLIEEGQVVHEGQGGEEEGELIYQLQEQEQEQQPDENKEQQQATAAAAALLRCPICGQFKSSRKQLKNHIDFHRTSSRFYHCSICGKFIKKGSRMRAHVKTHAHDVAAAAAAKTDDKEDDKREIRGRLKEEEEEGVGSGGTTDDQSGAKKVETFTCKTCWTIFIDKAQFLEHQVLHPPPGKGTPGGAQSQKEKPRRRKIKYPGQPIKDIQRRAYRSCLSCQSMLGGNSSYESEYLGQQLMIACERHRDDTLRCEICGKLCCDRNFYEMHWWSHLGPQEKKEEKERRGKEFLCTLCGKAFTMNILLEQHIKRTHRPPDSEIYDCTKCNKTFITKAGFRRHERLHNEGEPVTCLHCSKVFEFKELLNSHRLTCDGLRSERPCQCTICSRNFVDGKSLLCHLTRLHKLNPATEAKAIAYDQMSQSGAPYSLKKYKHKSRGKMVEIVTCEVTEEM